MKKITKKILYQSDRVPNGCWEMFDSQSFYASEQALADSAFEEKLLEKNFVVSCHGTEEIYSYGSVEIIVRDIRTSKKLLFQEFWEAVSEEDMSVLTEVTYSETQLPAPREYAVRYCTPTEVEAEIAAITENGYCMTGFGETYKQYIQKEWGVGVTFSKCVLNDADDQIRWLQEILDEVERSYPTRQDVLPETISVADYIRTHENISIVEIIGKNFHIRKSDRDMLSDTALCQQLLDQTQMAKCSVQGNVLRVEYMAD